MDTYSTMRPINFLLKCFALNCVYKKDNNVASSWSLIQNLSIMFIMCSINVFILYNEAQERDFKSFEFTLTDAYVFTFLLSFFKYVVDLVFVRKYCKKECVDYYYAYDKIDNILKTNDYNKIKVTCLKIMVFTSALFSFAIILDFLAWYLPYKFIYMLALFVYFYEFLRTLNILEMVSHVFQVEHRLCILGDIVEKFNKNSKDVSKWVTVRWFVNYEATRLDRLTVLDERAARNDIGTPDDILQLSQCYLLLMKQTEFINTMFGFRVSISYFTRF